MTGYVGLGPIFRFWEGGGVGSLDRTQRFLDIIALLSGGGISEEDIGRRVKKRSELGEEVRRSGEVGRRKL